MRRPDVAQMLLELIGREAAPPRPFEKAAEGTRPIRVWAAPGRLDVLGALGAEAGGTVAQMALPSRIAVAVQALERRELVVISEGMEESSGAEFVAALEGLECGEGTVCGGTWGGLMLGLWRALGDAGAALPAGLAVRIHSAIPMRAGQGSSTALLTATALGILHLTGGQMETTALAEAIGRAEALAAGMRAVNNGHVIDALTSLSAEAGTMLRYSAQPHRLVGPVPTPPDLRVLALDTGVRYASARETLEELRLASAMGVRIIDTIYRDLGQAHTPLHGYLSNTSPLLYRQYFRTLLPKRLRGSDFLRTYGALAEGAVLDGAKFYRVRTAVDHLMAEHEHAEQFLQAMEELADMPGWGDKEEEAERQRTLQRAGRLALASHHSYRLRLELSCREADWLVDRLMEFGPECGIYGARITGCGGGGTVMALVDWGQRATDAILEVMKLYSQMNGLMLGVTEAGAGGALGRTDAKE